MRARTALLELIGNIHIDRLPDVLIDTRDFLSGAAGVLLLLLLLLLLMMMLLLLMSSETLPGSSGKVSTASTVRDRDVLLIFFLSLSLTMSHLSLID